jgi:lipopolysaccharide transport system ATP-binding protein
MSLPDTTPLIALRQVGLAYASPLTRFAPARDGRVHALHDVSFDVFEGDKLGVIGRNGSGKSTLMRILARIYDPDTGTVRFGRKIHVQMLSLGVGFEGSLTGRENAVLNGMLLGKSRAHMLGRLAGIKEFSELEDFFEMPVATYSAGMVLRLGFSVAMETDPDVLLIDEVLGVGDASFARKSQDALVARFSSKMTVIMISHDPTIIGTFCTRAVWIDAGRTRMVGTAADVAAAYQKTSSPDAPPRLHHQSGRLDADAPR